MLPIDKLSTELPAGWFAFVLVLSVILLFGKKVAAWFLMKLYEFLIGHENRVTDIGQ
jgi:hypothetical protein